MQFLHRHTWASIGATHLMLQHYKRTGEEFGPPKPITEVLQRCECQKLRTISLDGEWTLEQINRGIST